MIDKGAWQTDPQPKLPKSYKDYRVLFRFGFLFKGFKFISELLKDVNGDSLWFVYPYNKEFKKKFFVISDEIKPSKYYQRDIYNLSINNEKLKHLFSTFKENKIFFSSDLCGTDFKQVIDFSLRR